MSVAIRSAKMNIHPEYYDSTKNGNRFFNTTIFNPQQISLEVSPDAKQPVEQIKAIIANCADNGIELEIEFSPVKDRFGNEKFVIYDVKPLPKKAGV